MRFNPDKAEELLVGFIPQPRKGVFIYVVWGYTTTETLLPDQSLEVLLLPETQTAAADQSVFYQRKLIC